MAWRVKMFLPGEKEPDYIATVFEDEVGEVLKDEDIRKGRLEMEYIMGSADSYSESLKEMGPMGVLSMAGIPEELEGQLRDMFADMEKSLKDGTFDEKVANGTFDIRPADLSDIPDIERKIIEKRKEESHEGESL